MNFIIDPINLNRVSIYTKEGKTLLKQYISQYQLGGSNVYDNRYVDYSLYDYDSDSYYDSDSDSDADEQSSKNIDTDVVSSELKNHIIPCDEKTFCETRDLICKTNYDGIDGIRKCGVLIKSNWLIFFQILKSIK